VVNRNRLDMNCVAHSDNAAVNSGHEQVAVEGNVAPCQGAGKRAEHSAGHRCHDMIDGRSDRRALAGTVVRAQRPLHTIHHRLRHFAEISMTLTVVIFEARMREI